MFKFNVMMGDFTTYTFLLSMLLLFSITSPIWLFVPAAVFVVLWILVSEQKMRRTLIDAKMRAIRQAAADRRHGVD